jgi:hypothetical protein
MMTKKRLHIKRKSRSQSTPKRKNKRRKAPKRKKLLRSLKESF